MPRLENWSVVAITYFDRRLRGQIFGSEAHDDGKEIITTHIVGKTASGAVQTWSGSNYELGTPESKYEAAFPNAKTRLLARLHVVEVR